jgi:leucyl/phenylalanyl-tRNA--protein transferase
MYRLTNELYFPPVDSASTEGILAFGGDLAHERLMLAYRSGIFPWFNIDEPVIWWSPNPRMVLFLDEFKVSKSMRSLLNRNVFRVTFNQDFSAVIRNCQKIIRPGQDGSWISEQMISAYEKLHQLGHVMSIEVWQDEALVGGLYGVDLGHVFSGESMFSSVSNASKVAFVSLVNYLKSNQYELLDCQVYNEHLASLGCREISRDDFMKVLKRTS